MYTMRRPKSGVDRHPTPGSGAPEGEGGTGAGVPLPGSHYLRRRIGFFLLTALFFGVGVAAMIR